MTRGTVPGLVFVSVFAVMGLLGASRTLAPVIPDPPPPPSNDCTEAGGFCARMDGFTGGCAYTSCCADGQTYCYSSERVPYPWPRLISDPNGGCWKLDGGSANWCLNTECVGSLCQGTPCTATGAISYIKKSLPHAINASCLPKQ